MQISESAVFCCNLNQFVSFGDAGKEAIKKHFLEEAPRYVDTRLSYIATTTQKQTAANEALQELGFKIIAVFPSDHGVYNDFIWFKQQTWRSGGRYKNRATGQLLKSCGSKGV